MRERKRTAPTLIRETILMADKANGRLDVISEFRRDPNDNNRISVVTVTPETKNRASYYTLMFAAMRPKRSPICAIRIS